MKSDEHLTQTEPDRASDESRLEDDSGRAEQITCLFDEHNRSLVRFLRARLHSEEEAKELAQEAYVRLLRLDDTDTISYLRAYLFRIAANLATDRLKQRDRRARIRNVVLFDAGEVSPAPERGLAASDELALVREAIEELPAKCRMAFLLHKIHELSVVETARQMELSVRMVRLYIARALAHCRERLDAAEQAGGRDDEN